MQQPPAPAYSSTGTSLEVWAAPAGEHTHVYTPGNLVQDTIVECAPQMSQQLALAALQEGGEHVRQGVAGLSHNRQLVADALCGNSRGVYANGNDAAAAAAAAGGGDEAVVEWLVKEHGVCIIPSSACGAPGHVCAWRLPTCGLHSARPPLPD
ncbi:hypothetical protein COO60DRAFT_1556089 [Scenedesmus sp. NREL 46B-D3]|nr:hypothetical protein COO60DRAFT_1556089 [Scenedesmus sp. NREL 46B-D3]